MDSDIATTAPPATGGGSMIEIASSRQAQEVQIAMACAKRCPRDETAAIARINQACKREGLARKARYKYPRGRTSVTGPSIRLAEVLARCWGNLDFGIVELEQRDGESDVMTYCWDLETNTRQTKIFTVRHERHKKVDDVVTVTQLTDPRDIYEMAANYGARRLRACILGIIPGDVQDLAVAACAKTLIGDSDEPLIDKVRKMVIAFGEMSVDQDALERYLKHTVDTCDEVEIVDLRAVFASLKDGMTRREDWFILDAAGAEVAAKLKDPPADATPPQTQADEGEGQHPAPEVPPEDPPAAEGKETEGQLLAQQYYAAMDGETTEEAVDVLATQATEAATAVILGETLVQAVMDHGKKCKNQIRRA